MAWLEVPEDPIYVNLYKLLSNGSGLTILLVQEFSLFILHKDSLPNL